MRIILIVSLIVFSISNGFSQSSDYFQKDIGADTAYFKVETRDGSVFIGQITFQDSSVVEMLTISKAQVKVSRSQVVSLTTVNPVDLHKGKYWFRNPNTTRYLFGPSAFMLEPGEGYYQNTYLLLNSFNVGVTKNISVGGGFELISLFAKGSGGPIFFLTPKVGFEITDKLRAGGGVYYVNVPGLNGSQRYGAGIAYGMSTYGTSNSNITGGIGWGFVQEGEFSDQPVLTLSGMHRISKKTALVSENWFVPWDTGYYGLFSYGIRFFGEKVAVDLAFINNDDIANAILIGIPYIDFVVKF